MRTRRRHLLAALLCGLLPAAGCIAQVTPNLTQGGPISARELVFGRPTVEISVTSNVSMLGRSETAFLLFMVGSHYSHDSTAQAFLDLLVQELQQVGFDIAGGGREPDVKLKATLVNASYEFVFMWLFVGYIPPFPLWWEASPLLATEVELETPDGVYTRRFKSYRLAAGRANEDRIAATWRDNASRIAEAVADCVQGGAR